MPIVFHKNTNTFHIYNLQVSYIFKVLENGSLGQLYFGKKLRDKESFDELLEMKKRAMAPYTFEGNLLGMVICAILLSLLVTKMVVL